MSSPSSLIDKRLPQSFYARDTETVARDLLGCVFLRRLGRQWLGGTIVETEAYLPKNDPACHASKRRTPSNEAMFGRPGTLYVYPIHGKYCLNAVTEEADRGCAVLIRALQPEFGIAKMQEHRGQEQLKKLTSGPAMLCQALDVTREQDHTNLINDSKILIAHGETLEADQITASPRIGIREGVDFLLRFFVDGNPYVSGRKSDHRSFR